MNGVLFKYPINSKNHEKIKANALVTTVTSAFAFIFRPVGPTGPVGLIPTGPDPRV